MTTALGMHRDADQNPKMATISSEMRRRIYAAVFNIDKVIATFTGRPPMLSHHYSSTPLPLDLSDEQLLSDREELFRIVGRLDANGWNTDSQIYSTTILRARTSFSMIRSEVLDMALSSVPDDIRGRIMYVRQLQIPHFISTANPHPLFFKNTDDCLPENLNNGRNTHMLNYLLSLFVIEKICQISKYLAGCYIHDS